MRQDKKPVVKYPSLIDNPRIETCIELERFFKEKKIHYTRSPPYSTRTLIEALNNRSDSAYLAQKLKQIFQHET